jgi:hypothetical protein
MIRLAKAAPAKVAATASDANTDLMMSCVEKVGEVLS